MVNNKVSGLLGLATKAGKIVSGFEAVSECVEKKKAKLVIVSIEASDKTKNNIKYICEKNNVMCIEYAEINFLSQAIGKKNKAIIGIKDNNFATAIKNILMEGI